ncbi:MAG: Stp1/IreP family PP2C-type Ser/Thr phosphatase [Acidimicrobiales bacterium]
MSLRLRAAAATDVGNIRDNNQDDMLLVDDALYVVADGMGGHVAGEVASREAVETMRDAYGAPGSADDVRQAVRLANGAVWKRGTDDPACRGMGTTVTVVAVVEDDKLAVANVGDSRTYLLRDGDLVQLTQDHSFVQEAVRSGQLTHSQAESHPRRSQLTRALGVGDDVDVDVDVLEPLTSDRLLLCSDGLWDEVGDELIEMVLANHPEPEEAAAKLVLWAKEAGGRDNITVIVVDVVDGAEEGRAISAGAALDQAGDEQTASSRSAVSTQLLSDTDPSDTSTKPEAGDESWKVRQETVDPWSARNARADPSLMVATGPAGSRPRLLTWRVVVFVVVLVGVLGVAAVVVARGVAEPAWVVGLDGNDVVIKEGDQIVERTPLQVNQIPPSFQTELGRGQRVEDRADAQEYVAGLTRRALLEGTLKPGAGVVVTTTMPGATSAPVTASPPPASTVVGP